jgi:hypothetical protein
LHPYFLQKSFNLPELFTDNLIFPFNFTTSITMSSREKNLIMLLLLAGFLMLNFFLYTQYDQKKALLETNLETAKTELQLAILAQESSAEYAAQMDWLAQHEPAAAEYQTIQAELQSFAASEAQKTGLTIRPPQEFLATDITGTHFHRAQIKINVTGREQDLYRWLHIINEPTAFRAAINIRLAPNSQEDTLIDCTAVIAQWFPPNKSDS